MRISLSALLAGLATFAIAITLQEAYTPRSLAHLPGRDLDADTSTIRSSTFEQPIDHTNASVATFSQFYYYSDEWWTEGGPVVFFTPGEVNVTGYGTYASLNRTTGVLASEISTAVNLLEHRYWRMSSAYVNLTTVNMQYLNLENAIQISPTLP
jgi:hypothetical protein